MRTTGRATLTAMTVLAGMSVSGWAQDKAEPADKPAQDIRLKLDEVDAKIADLQRQKEDLEQKRQETERLAELQEALTGLHNESRERIKEADEQLAEIEKEEPVKPAQHALVEGRRKHLGNRKTLDIKILAITDGKVLEQAQQVREEIDALETEWRIVQEPTFSSATTLEELETSLAENNSQARREMLEKLRQLAAKDAESRTQEYTILKERQEREKVWHKLVQDFHQAQ